MGRVCNVLHRHGFSTFYTCGTDSAEEEWVKPGRQIMKEANFWTSRIVLTAAELDIFTHLDGESLDAPLLAQRLGSDPRATDRLLDALVALDLLQKHGDAFSLSDSGAFLSSKHPETLLPSVLHYAGLWEKWGRLTTVIREGKPAASGGPVQMDDATRRAFIGAMDRAGRDLSIRIAESFDASRFKKLIDIGGASGTYTVAFLRKNPGMTAVLFDLPPVVAIARERIEAEGLSDRVVLVPGDYNKDAFPHGCDMAFLSAVIHQNSPSQNLDLFKKIYSVLQPEGMVLIRDFVMDSTRTLPRMGAFFALNMLVNTAGGDTYTFEEIRESLTEAGFVDVELHRGGDEQDDLVSARKRRD
jgi:ubiquinone/menaquinone biosynthesis C-methylase UbiE